jgi:hypothetical protein
MLEEKSSASVGDGTPAVVLNWILGKWGWRVWIGFILLIRDEWQVVVKPAVNLPVP